MKQVYIVNSIYIKVSWHGFVLFSCVRTKMGSAFQIRVRQVEKSIRTHLILLFACCILIQMDCGGSLMHTELCRIQHTEPPVKLMNNNLE